MTDNIPLEITKESGLFISEDQYETITVNGQELKLPKRPLKPAKYNYDNIIFKKSSSKKGLIDGNGCRITNNST